MQQSEAVQAVPFPVREVYEQDGGGCVVVLKAPVLDVAWTAELGGDPDGDVMPLEDREYVDRIDVPRRDGYLAGFVYGKEEAGGLWPMVPTRPLDLLTWNAHGLAPVDWKVTRPMEFDLVRASAPGDASSPPYRRRSVIDAHPIDGGSRWITYRSRSWWEEDGAGGALAVTHVATGASIGYARDESTIERAALVLRDWTDVIDAYALGGIQHGPMPPALRAELEAVGFTVGGGWDKDRFQAMPTEPAR